MAALTRVSERTSGGREERSVLVRSRLVNLVASFSPLKKQINSLSGSPFF